MRLAVLAALVAAGVAATAQVPVTSGLVLRFDSELGVTTSGSNVTAWADQSGSGNNLTGSGFPRVGVTQTPSGRPAITFDGIDDKLERTSALTALPAGNTDRTMFAVVRYNSSTGWAGFAYGTAAANQAFGIYIKHPTGELGLHGWGTGNDLISTTPGRGAGWLVQSGTVSGGVGRLFKNGVQIAQFTHAYNTIVSKFVMGVEMANAGYVGMDVAEVLVYNRVLSAAEQDSVQGYLQGRHLQDTTPPVITVPADIVAEATGSGGAVVTFTTSAVDTVSGPAATTNTPASGSLFPLGVTTVTTTATDASGNSANRTFTVTVRDTTPPVITVPAGLGVQASDEMGAIVSFTTSATDSVSGPAETTDSPPSGSLFPFGATTVTTTAEDAAGNVATRTFTINVLLGPAGLPLLTDGLVLHLNPTEGVSVSESSVTLWADLSGNGNDVEPVGNPRTGEVLTPSGLPAISLDGVQDKLQRTAPTIGLPVANQDRTMFVVARYNSTSVSGGVTFGAAGENQAFSLGVNHPGGELLASAFGSGNDLISTTAGTGTGWLVESVLVEDGVTTLFKDGTQIALSTHEYDTVPATILIGADLLDEGRIGMDVAAVLVYGRALTGPERARVESFLRGRYIGDTGPPSTVSFAAPFRVSNDGFGAIGAAAGDLNNDGCCEFVSASSKASGSGHLRIYTRDQATGAWATYTLLNGPQVATRGDRFGGDLATGDLNNDGFADIIVPDSDNSGNAGRLSWFENPRGNLGGAWVEREITRWTGSPGDRVAHMGEVAAGDVDGNGWQDVVTRDVADGCFVMLRTDDGMGWKPRRFIPCNPREGLELWDPDRDGDLDILINGVWFETPADPVYGEYILHTIAAAWYPPDTSPGAIADFAAVVGTGDFNGDGRIDVAISKAEQLAGSPLSQTKPRGIRVYLSPPDPLAGQWSEVILETTGFSWQSLAVTDVNQDGHLDVLAGVSSVGYEGPQPKIVAFLNDRTGLNFTPAIIAAGKDSLNANMFAYHFAAGDVDGDRFPDLFAPDNWNNGPIRFFANTAAPVPSAAPPAPAGLAAVAISPTQVSLSWTDLSPGGSACKIERALGEGAFVQIARTSAGVNTFTDSGATESTDCRYRIRATNSAGDSLYTDEAAATTPADVTPPDVQRITSAADGTVTIVFTERVDKTGAEMADRYSFSGGVTVVSATLPADARTVTLATTGLVDGVLYTLSIVGVPDISAAANASNCIASFTHAAWVSADIGTGTTAGTTSFDSPVIFVAGSGADIASTADAFRFTYRSFTGDVQIVTCLTGQTRADALSKAGVMIRETAATGAKNVFLALTPDTGALFSYRATTGGATVSADANAVPGTLLRVPCWLKLLRRGDQFTAWTSPDGIAWTPAGAIELPMAAPVFVGLGVTARNNMWLSTARFEPTRIIRAVPPAAPDGLVAMPVTPRRIDLAWSDQSTTESGFRIERRVEEGEFMQIAQTPPGLTTFTDEALAPNTAYIYRIIAFNEFGDSEPTAEISATTLIDPFFDWQNANFGPQPLAEDAADLADPDGDLLPNVFEYFLGTDPRLGDAALPFQRSLTDRLTLTFPRSTAATDVIVFVQGADAPGGEWTDLAVSVNGAPFIPLDPAVPVVEDGDGAVRSVQVGDLYTTGDPEHPARFMRLRLQR